MNPKSPSDALVKPWPYLMRVVNRRKGLILQVFNTNITEVFDRRPKEVFIANQVVSQGNCSA